MMIYRGLVRINLRYNGLKDSISLKRLLLCKQTYLQGFVYHNQLLLLFPFYKVNYMKQKKTLGLILIFLIVSATEVNTNDHIQYQAANQAKKQVATPTIDVQVPSNNKPLSIKGPTIDSFAQDKDRKQAIVTNTIVVPTQDDKNERQKFNNNSTTLKASDSKEQSLKENPKSSINSLQKQQIIEKKELKQNEIFKESSRKNTVKNQSKHNQINNIDEKLKTQAIQEKIQRENNPQTQQLKPKESNNLKPAQKHDEKQVENEQTKIKLQRPLQANNSKIQVKQAQQVKKNGQKENIPITPKPQKTKKQQNQLKKQVALQQKSEEAIKNMKVDSILKVQIVNKDFIIRNQSSTISIIKNDSVKIPIIKNDSVKTPQNQIKIIPLSQQQTETQEEQQVVENKVKNAKPAQQKQEQTKVQQIVKKNIIKEKIKQTQTQQQPNKKQEEIEQKKVQTIKQEKKQPSIYQKQQQIKINQKLPQPTKKSQEVQKKGDISKQTHQAQLQESIKSEKNLEIKVVKSEQTSKKPAQLKQNQTDVKIIPINDNKTKQIQKTEFKDMKVQIQSKDPVSIKKQQKVTDIDEQKTLVQEAQERMNPIIVQPSKTQQSQPNLKELLKEVKLDLNQKAKENIIKHLQNQIKLTEQKEKTQVGSSQQLEKKEKQQHLKQQQLQSPIIKQEKQTSSEEIMDTPTIMVIIVFTFIISIPIFKEIKLRPPAIQESQQKESNEPTGFVTQESNQRFGMEFSDMDNQTGCAIGEPYDQQQR